MIPKDSFKTHLMEKLLLADLYLMQNKKTFSVVLVVSEFIMEANHEAYQC